MNVVALLRTVFDRYQVGVCPLGDGRFFYVCAMSPRECPRRHVEMGYVLLADRHRLPYLWRDRRALDDGLTGGHTRRNSRLPYRSDHNGLSDLLDTY